MTRKRDIQAYEPYVEAALAAGCPPDQVDNFCRIHYVAQAKQLRFHAACRAADEPGGPTQIAYGGARGPGKSHALLAQIGADDCQRCPGLKCLLLRKVGKSGREQFEDLRLKLFRRLPHEYRRTGGSITFTNGSRILLGHFQDESDVDAYLGLEYDVIGVEEATTLTHAKYVAVQSCNRTSKPNFRPRIYTTANPGGVGHAWYKQLFVLPYDQGAEAASLRSPDPGASGRGGAGTATRFIPATIDDNCFVNPDYRATLDGLTGWLKRAWRYGDWDIAAGQFFTTFRRDLHAVQAFPIPPNWPVWLAMDYGFTHYNVILLFAQGPEGPGRDGLVYVVDELAERRWLPARHAPVLAAMLARHDIHPARLSSFVAGRDCFASRPTDLGSIADQWAAAGWPLDPADDDRINGAAEILRRLGDHDNGIPPTLYIFHTCARLLDCLPALEHDPHRPEDVLKWDTDDDGIGGDDPYDALRYGLLALPSSPGSSLAHVAERLGSWRG